MYVAEHVVFIDPESDVRLDLCIRVAATDRYCFSMTRTSTELRLLSRGRAETIATGAPVVPFAGDKTLTVFVQPSTFTLYAGDRVVLEAQDTRLPQGDLDPGVGAGKVGSTVGGVTVKGYRVWEVHPPRSAARGGRVALALR